MEGGQVPFEQIRKRDGRIVPFEITKIVQAIFAAVRAVGGDDYSRAEQLAGEVVDFLAHRTLPGVIPTVEEIQDVVEKVLIERGHARTAKAYILYRAGRTRIREARSELMDVVKDILVEKENEQTGEKGRYSPAEKMHRIALAASHRYYLDNLLPREIADAHTRGSLHIHQLGYYSKTLDSLQLDLYPLLRTGFNHNERILSRDFLGTLLRVIAILQRSCNDLYGEVALPGFDTALGRVLRSGGNHPGRAGLTATLNSFLAYLGALSGFGGRNPLNYSMALGLDTTAEGMAVTGALLQGLEGKVGPKNGPQVIFMLKKGINMAEDEPGYPLYRLALQAALGGSHIAFSTEPYCFSSGVRVAENRCGAPGGGGRGNIAAVTLNLPRLAYTFQEEELFFVELDRLLRLAVRQLLHRFEVLTALHCRDLPFVMGAGLYRGSKNLSMEESIKKSLEQGLMTLCFCGLREAVRLLGRGQEESSEDVGQMFLRIAGHLARRVHSFAEEYDLNIVLCGVADETHAQRFVQQDRQDFGLIRGVTDREYYSSGFPLFQEDDGLAYKMEREGALHRCCTGGFASVAVPFFGLEVEGIMDFINTMAAAGISFFRFSPGRVI